MQKAVIAFMGILIIALLGGAGFVVGTMMFRNEEAGEQTRESTPKSTQSDASNPLQVNGNGSTFQSQSSTIPLNGGTGNSGSANGSNSIPTPDQFGQFDQYKTSNEALYADAKIGTGAEATSGKKVSMLYRGWLTNGQVFDESTADKPFTFTLGAGQVIRGWEQTVPGMKVGGERMLIIPPAVGYGQAGQGPIPGGSVLVFYVQLVAVE